MMSVLPGDVCTNTRRSVCPGMYKEKPMDDTHSQAVSSNSLGSDIGRVGGTSVIRVASEIHLTFRVRQ